MTTLFNYNLAKFPYKKLKDIKYDCIILSKADINFFVINFLIFLYKIFHYCV